MKLTINHARKVLQTVDQGLCHGLGQAEPGEMCVESAVCYALGLPHGDNPLCVGAAVRQFKIRLNDSKWKSDKSRSRGMRKLAIAQLGSDQIDQVEFAKYVSEQTIRRIVPLALLAAARAVPKHAKALMAAAKRCRREGTLEAASAAYSAAYSAASAGPLLVAAEIAIEALKKLKSPGCKWLRLCD